MRVAIASLVALVACHHHTHRPGEEWLQSIRFEGNHAFGDGALRTGLALHRVEKQGSAPDPFVIAQDTERITGLYIRHGYFEVWVRPRVERRGDAQTVTFVIDEGSRATTRVDITGIADDKLRDTVRGKLALADNATFDYDTYDAAKPLLLAAVEDAGYAHARLDAHVVADRANRRAVVVLAFVLGLPCKFGEISIDGVTGELADAVRARIAFRAGEPYSISAIAKTQRELYAMGRFSMVRVVPEKHDLDVIRARVTVTLASRNELVLGGGLAVDPTVFEARARLGYTILGWPFALDTLAIELRPAYAMLRDGTGYEPRMRASTKLTRMDLFHPYLTGEAEVGYDYLVWEAYTSLGPRARLGLATPILTRRVKLRIGWQIQQASFAHLDALIDPATAHSLGLDQSERVGMYQQSLIVDLRDNPLEPHSGGYADLELNEGTRFALGNKEFLQATPELRGYLPIFDWTLAARARYGAIVGDIPVLERYYSGGATTQRGFSERRLAPTLAGDVNGTFHSIPIGGGGLFETNLELRARIASVRDIPVGGVVFLDGGDVTATPSQLQFGHLNWAAGAGLRAFTKIGAARFDVGYRLNRTGPTDPEPGSHFAFHLSIGEAF